MEELKPVRCGCGGEPVVGHIETSGRWYIGCPDCDICTGLYNTEADVITAWNKAMGADKVDELMPKWIHVSEALPEDMDRLLVTIVRPNGEKRVRSGDYFKGYFMMDNGDTWKETDKEVIAWMPLVEPYKEGE